MSFDPEREDDLRRVMGHFPSGIIVVAAMHGGDPVGFTCQSFASLSLKPPLALFAAAKTSTTFPRIRAAGTFVANILAEDQSQIARRFAVSGENKFVDVHWSRGRLGAPIIDGALAWVGCRLVTEHEAGDHFLVIGQVAEIGHAPEGRPLTFFQGRFSTLRA
jgi:3-hydroxy-9,10-secoandrosta-1,3,5(10)-triene-9,17-dione monooxygenase reductase component